MKDKDKKEDEIIKKVNKAILKDSEEKIEQFNQESETEFNLILKEITNYSYS